MVIPGVLTDLPASSLNPSISIFKGLCFYQATYTEISQDKPSFDCC